MARVKPYKASILYPKSAFYSESYFDQKIGPGVWWRKEKERKKEKPTMLIVCNGVKGPGGD